MGISILKSLILGGLHNHRARPETPAWSPSASNGSHGSLVAEDSFLQILRREQKRTERSRKPFLLMLLEGGAGSSTAASEAMLLRLLGALSASVRETDTIGWYKHSSVLGVIFTEIGAGDKAAIRETVAAKVSAALRRELALEQGQELRISFHFFPEDQEGSPLSHRLFVDLSEQQEPKRLAQFVKRAVDVVGSGLGVLLLAPLFALIAGAIKLSSKGPVLLRQERIGRYGRPFTFLKFRTMQCNSDPSIHKEYIRGFIAGQANGSGIYKLTNDPRVTSLGRFLRKTSLDELPQLWNVLRGQMSLVGPRPPLPYEFESYDLWHKRRLWEARPGITGLWQVNGRSRTTFEEMVRQDLHYAKTWSLWLDLKILLLTPGAVLSGEGAY